MKQELMSKEMQLKTLNNALFLRLTSKQHSILQSDVNRPYELAIKEQPNQIDIAVKIFKVVVDSADIYFGVRSGNLSEALTDKVVKKILESYSELSVSDIEYAYERFRKEKTDWRNVTFDELINPIKQYHKIKFAISTERKLMEKELKEKTEREHKEIEFIKISIDLYKKSIGLDYYLGDVFQSRKIYGKFISRISEDILNEFKLEAKRKNKKLLEENSYNILFTPERLYAKMICDYAAKNKFNLD